MARPLSQSQLKFYRGLLTKKYRQQYGQFLVEGLRLCEEALAVGHVRVCIVDNSLIPRGRMKKLLAAVEEHHIPFFSLAHSSFLTLCETQSPQGVILVADKPQYFLSDIVQRKSARILALDAIKDPGNLGTIIRTASWFGIDALMLSKSSVDCFNSKVVRSSMGGLFHLPIFPDLDLAAVLDSCKTHGFFIQAAVVSGGVFPPSKHRKACMLMGTEAKGIQKTLLSLADEHISIPRRGSGDSLNVAMASGILMYEMSK